MSNLKVVERIEPTLIPALFKNFDNAEIAMLELIDNAIDDRIEDKSLEIAINIDEFTIVIKNVGGYGMSFNDLSAFFSWGTSNKSTQIGRLGRYGQGGKAAMGYLAGACQIVTSKLDEDTEYLVEIENWGTREGEFVDAEVIERDADNKEQGSVTIKLWNLNKRIIIGNLRNTLSETYAPLLRKNKIKIYVNKQPLLGFEMPYESETKKEEIELSGGKKAKVEVGLIKPRKGLSGGFRCYEFGRLVTMGEYFGQKTREDKYAFEKLSGELFIDFDIPLIMNKTNFDRDSEDWKAISKIMFSILEPWVKKLSGSRVDVSRVEEIHQKQVNKALEKFREDRIKSLKGTDDSISFENIVPDYCVEFRALDKRLRYEVVKEGSKYKFLINITYPAYKIWQKDMELYLVDIFVQELSRIKSTTIDEMIENTNVIFNDLSEKFK